MARIIDIDVELPVFMRGVEQLQADWNQNDTTQYTHSGQTYTGIIAYAAAKNITITN